MAYLSEFEGDIFISYARYDDEQLKKGEDGWVSHLHRALETLLRRRLGANPQIWRDVGLAGNEFLWDKLANQISKAAVLVSVVSPRYLKSDWCLREVQEFCRVADDHGGLRVDEDKARIFKVLLWPIPLEKHPAELQEFHGYELYEIDKETDKPHEWDPVQGEKAEQKFLGVVSDLAYDITTLLNLLKERDAARECKAPVGPVVYLAEASSDQAETRAAIRRELQEAGCLILPTRPVVTGPNFLENQVRDDLGRAQLSIHVIGENYGMVPEKAERSVVDLQHELAVARAADRAFTRVVWLPAGLSIKEERQTRFVEHLREDPAMQENVEFLEGSIEDLKTCVERRVRALRTPPPVSARAAAGAADEGPRRVYIICDQADRNAVKPISDYLFSRDIEPILPLTEGDEAQVREDHKDNLTTCDGTLIYHGAGGEIWLRTKRNDLKKAAGFGRTKPMLGQAIYLGAPETPAKREFRTHEAEVIQGFGAFSPQALDDFIAKLNPGGRRSA